MERERTLAVTGRGFAASEPDVANITVRVRIVAATLPAAANKASTDMARMMDLLRGLAVAGAGFKTRRFSVYSQERPVGSGGQCRRVKESVASNGLPVTVRGLSTIGSTISAVIAAGAGERVGLRFHLDDPEPLARAARVDAVRDAVGRANKHVGAAGVRLGPNPLITETQVDGAHRPGGGLLSLGGATGDLAGSPPETPVESGDITASAAFHLVWGLE